MRKEFRQCIGHYVSDAVFDGQGNPLPILALGDYLLAMTAHREDLDITWRCFVAIVWHFSSHKKSGRLESLPP
jgi:hypothetical protein